MKLNNRGIAITSILYIILVLAIILIASTLAILSSRKILLDKIKNQVDIDYKYEDGTVVFFDVTTGKMCSENLSNSEVGTDTGCMKFYIFNDTNDSDTLNLILDHNIKTKVKAEDIKELELVLQTATTDWDSSIKSSVRFITSQEILKILNINTLQNTNISNKYKWLYENSNYCTSTEGNTTDYGPTCWGISDSKLEEVYIYQDMGTNGKFYTSSIRPVITISKEKVFENNV